MQTSPLLSLKSNRAIAKLQCVIYWISGTAEYFTHICGLPVRTLTGLKVVLVHHPVYRPMEPMDMEHTASSEPRLFRKSTLLIKKKGSKKSTGSSSLTSVGLAESGTATDEETLQDSLPEGVDSTGRCCTSFHWNLTVHPSFHLILFVK